MARQALDAVLQHIRKVAAGSHKGWQDDRELLERFIDRQDRAAFAALMQRHGPMVRSVCWRLLRHEADTDDAFQATFLVMLRKARSIRKRRSLGSWLYGVAFRTALRARAVAAQRERHEMRATATAPAEPWRDAAWRELCTVLDEELQGLSEKYRDPLVLCYLEGRTRDEAAHQLGLSLRTLQRRLERGRELLRMRLSRRGLTLSIGLLATSLSEQAASAALPAGLLNLTVKAALLHAAGKATAAGLISAHAAVLAKGVLQAMFISKLTTLTTMVLAVGVTITGAGLWTYHSPAAQRTDAKEKKAVAPAIERGAESPALVGVPSQTDPKEKKAAGPASERGEELPALIRVPSQRDGIVRVIGTEIKEGEKVPPGQTITVKVDGEKRKYRRLKKGDSVEEAQLLALLDDDLARAEVDIKVAKVNSARAECRAAEKTRDEALARYETAKKLVGAGDKLAAISKEDLRGALLTFSRYFEEALSKAEAINVAEQELKQARKVLEMHEIRSPSPGVIRAIHKRPGEAVKYLEAVFLIQVPEE